MIKMQKNLDLNVGNVIIKIKKNRNEYYKKYNALHKKNKKTWRNNNKIKLMLYYRNKRKKDVQYLLASRFRCRINKALLGKTKKSLKTTKLLGCSLNEFKQYIESKFLHGMNWDKKHLFHIDHIRPCASFDLTIPEEQAKCFHYTNLQPLWAKDNLSKGAKYDG